MILDNKVILEKIREYFQNPIGAPDLPRYIVGVWGIRRRKSFKTAAEIEAEKQIHGAIFNTERLEDLRALLFVLQNNEVKDLRLYQITPQRIVYLLGVKV